MKTLNIPLEDKEYEALLKIKGNNTWREFLLKLIDENEDKINKMAKKED